MFKTLSRRLWWVHMMIVVATLSAMMSRFLVKYITPKMNVAGVS